MPSFFISYVYEDRTHAETLKQWAGKQLLGGWTAVMEEADVRAHGEKRVKEHISPRIKACTVLLLLVGANTHNHAWIDYELQHAKSSGLGVLSVRIPNTTGAPAKLAPREEIPLEPQALAQALANFSLPRRA